MSIVYIGGSMVYWWEYSVNVCGVLGAWCGCTVCISGQGVWASGGQGVWVSSG